MDYTTTKNEILNEFNISSLTLDNWIKNFIPDAIFNNYYSKSIIQKFITDEKKLCQRANKKLSKQLEVPKELLKYLHNTEWLEIFTCYIKNKPFEVISEELVHTLEQRVNKMSCSNELELIIPYNEIYAFSVAYQIILNSGEKSKTGAYYTPKFIINDILENLIEKNKTILEPCCGVGFFAIEYIKFYQNKFNCLPQNLLYCNDIDIFAVQITKLTILLFFPDLKFDIKCQNGLDLNWSIQFDFILTNPPYGIKHKHHNLKTTEIFSQFIYSSLFKYLKTDGIMNFVLPSSVLSVNRHKEIRKIILDKFSLEKIKFYGKSFQGVFSDIVFLQIKNNNKINPNIQLIYQDFFFVHQQSFIDNNYIISISNKKEQKTIDDFFTLPHVTLKNSKFSLGIVTGNNSYFLSESPKNHTIPIISGKEIEPGKILFQNQKYILNLFDKFQQKPKTHLFYKPKIVYKFISNKIISSVDYSGVLTLNSANFFIPESNGLSYEYISAILNSELLNRIHKNKNGSPLKVLKQHLKELPIFIFSQKIQDIITNNYKNGLHSENNLIIEKQVRLFLKNNSK